MWLEKGLKKRGKEVKMIDVYDKRYYNPSKNEVLSKSIELSEFRFSFGFKLRS